MKLMCEEVEDSDMSSHTTSKIRGCTDGRGIVTTSPTNPGPDDDEHANEEVVFADPTGKVLDYNRVIDARLNEIDDLIKMGVWELTPLSQCVAKTHRRPIRGRLVDVNKGDDMFESYRSTSVARQVRRQ